jgi:hypothetical protein
LIGIKFLNIFPTKVPLLRIVRFEGCPVAQWCPVHRLESFDEFYFPNRVFAVPRAWFFLSLVITYHSFVVGSLSVPYIALSRLFLPRVGNLLHVDFLA